MQAVCTIDAGYYMLGLEQEKLNALEQRKPKDVMVDKATGYSPYLVIYKNIFIIVKDMIKAKKILGDDVSKDTEILNTVKKKIELLSS